MPSARSACPRVPPRAAARHDAHVDGGDGRVPFHRPRLRWSDGGAPTRPRTDPSRSRPHSRAVSPGPPVRSRAGCGPESPRAQGQRVVLQEGCTAPVRLVRCGAVCGRSLFWASAALRGDSKAPIAPNTAAALHLEQPGRCHQARGRPPRLPQGALQGAAPHAACSLPARSCPAGTGLGAVPDGRRCDASRLFRRRRLRVTPAVPGRGSTRPPELCHRPRGTGWDGVGRGGTGLGDARSGARPCRSAGSPRGPGWRRPRPGGGGRRRGGGGGGGAGQRGTRRSCLSPWAVGAGPGPPRPRCGFSSPTRCCSAPPGAPRPPAPVRGGGQRGETPRRCRGAGGAAIGSAGPGVPAGRGGAAGPGSVPRGEGVERSGPPALSLAAVSGQDRAHRPCWCPARGEVVAVGRGRCRKGPLRAAPTAAGGRLELLGRTGAVPAALGAAAAR